MNNPSEKNMVLIYAALAAVTFAAFEQVRLNDFVYYDDSKYIVENTNINTGLSAKSLIWALTSYRYMGHWHPLTWFSHILDCELFGLNPAGHHLMSLLFHIVNTLLLFWVFNRMTAAVWQSAFVAAVFAVHPLHVESVAWVSERKDVLSGLFWMLTLAAYVLYVERPTPWKYLLVVLYLCLGLMAKSMLVTLPFVLLLLDYWPLKRFNRQQALPVVLEKLPLAIPLVISSVMAYAAQQSTGTVVAMADSSLTARIENVLVSYVSYIGKIFYPDGLAVLYPRHDFPVWQPVVSFLILAGISAAVFFARQSRPYLMTGWLWFLGTFVPVIGLVATGAQAIADRYTYLPSTGISIMAAWGFAGLFSGWQYRKNLLAVSAGVVISLMLICTRTQVLFWRNSVTLFKHTLDVTQNNPIISNNLGVVLSQQGRYDQAAENYRKAIRDCPVYAEAYYNLGIALQKQGQSDEAISNYRQALKLNPDYAEAYYNLGTILPAKGRFDEAIFCFNKAIQLKPDYAKAHNNLGNVFLAQGRLDEAISHFRRALQIESDYILPLCGLARILATNPDPKIRDTVQAISLAERAAVLTKYQDASVLEMLAVVYASAGQLNQAAETSEKALSLAADAGDNKLVELLRKQLENYKKGMNAQNVKSENEQKTP